MLLSSYTMHHLHHLGSSLTVRCTVSEWYTFPRCFTQTVHLLHSSSCITSIWSSASEYSCTLSPIYNTTVISGIMRIFSLAGSMLFPMPPLHIWKGLKKKENAFKNECNWYILSKLCKTAKFTVLIKKTTHFNTLTLSNQYQFKDISVLNRAQKCKLFLVRPTTGYEGPDGEYRYSSTL
jgi:hypothetical protein